MGIELQSAPQGHPKVGGARAQSNKLGDASQMDGTVGFAALMSLMASQEPEGASAMDTAVVPLSPLGSDGTVALSDATAVLVTAPPVDSALIALPFPGHPSVTFTSQFDPQGESAGRSPVATLGSTQPGLVFTAGVSVGEPSPLPPGLVQHESGFASSAGTTPTPIVFDPTSEMVSLAGGTFTALPTAAGQVPSNQLQGNMKSAEENLSSSPAPAVWVRSQAPTLVSLQTERVPAKAPRSSAEPSKFWTDAKPVPDSFAPAGQAPNLTTAETSIPALNEPQGPMPAVKPAGALNLQQAALAGQVRQDANGLATGMPGTAGLGTTPLPVPAFALSPQDAGIRLSDRSAKHLSGRFGLVGDGVYGQPMATSNPADALFQVPSTSATAASTVVAETVSYWASQGVQNASMKLDGFGDEPVEVRISVNGDMAQVDFRSNQPEVRQALEGAASQLKDMLSSQGMQLAGMSIGTSGRGGSQDKGTKVPSDARKLTLAKPEAVEVARVRPTNLSVGQSLDLFV